MKNRRRQRRVRIPEKVGATVTYCDALKNAPKGLVGDISGGGIYMFTDETLEKDSYVTMRIHTERYLGKPVYVQGLVVRTDESGMAIQFTYANDEDISSLLNF
ncbi:MAG TPA: PilZ domain-containing protein [Deltaproteobacteria bacterium]|nr:PilZ domain-containing protein [Deltaproteobacteria bacterium]HOM29331.1 PilZ domain-containing protein [Deltaproteobacteria bacterium]HPP81069.1 PilZ domain-containing protein [Deltaproteobacteria bacterium]